MFYRTATTVLLALLLSGSAFSAEPAPRRLLYPRLGLSLDLPDFGKAGPDDPPPFQWMAERDGRVSTLTGVAVRPPRSFVAVMAAIAAERESVKNDKMTLSRDSSGKEVMVRIDGTSIPDRVDGRLSYDSDVVIFGAGRNIHILSGTFSPARHTEVKKAMDSLEIGVAFPAPVATLAPVYQDPRYGIRFQCPDPEVVAPGADVILATFVAPRAEKSVMFLAIEKKPMPSENVFRQTLKDGGWNVLEQTAEDGQLAFRSTTTVDGQKHFQFDRWLARGPYTVRLKAQCAASATGQIPHEKTIMACFKSFRFHGREQGTVK